MNKILIAEEKHYTRYFDASTNEALHGACMKLLKERLEFGYYNGESKEQIQEFVNNDAFIMGKHYPKSYTLLSSNSDGEYEQIELEELENT